MGGHYWPMDVPSGWAAYPTSPKAQTAGGPLEFGPENLEKHKVLRTPLECSITLGLKAKLCIPCRMPDTLKWQVLPHPGLVRPVPGRPPDLRCSFTLTLFGTRWCSGHVYSRFRLMVNLPEGSRMIYRSSQAFGYSSCRFPEG